MRVILTAVLAMLAAVVPGAQSEKKGPTVAGSWELTIQGPAVHGNMTAALELRQEGKKVTGTLTAHGNTHSLAGTFADSELSVETTDTPAGQGMTLTAKLKDDGTLAGYLSSAHGDRQWTASRTENGKK